MKAEPGGDKRGNGGSGGNGNTSLGVPSNDDLVEVRSAAAGKLSSWDDLAGRGSVLGVVKYVSPDGGSLGLEVLASVGGGSGDCDRDTRLYVVCSFAFFFPS